MNQSKFPWGKKLETFEYNFDGKIFAITKFERHESERLPTDSVIQYHCEELHRVANSLEELLIAWLAHKNLGQNQYQYPLVVGVCKALNIPV